MLRVVSLPFCQVLMLDEWDAPPSRYFTAYLARGSSRWLMGHAVVDEFATLSSPVFLTPRALLGKIYNAGISLGHMRDSEMALDLGWPPFCVGVELPTPELVSDWEARMLQAVTESATENWGEPDQGSFREVSRPSHQIEAFRLADATVLAVSEPLLPRQLLRVCEAIKTPVSVAISVANRIERSKDGSPQTVQAISESKLSRLLKTIEGLD